MYVPTNNYDGRRNHHLHEHDGKGGGGGVFCFDGQSIARAPDTLPMGATTSHDRPFLWYGSKSEEE